MTSIFTLQHNSEGKFYWKINILINPTLDSKGEVFVACVNEGGDFRKNIEFCLLLLIHLREGGKENHTFTSTKTVSKFFKNLQIYHINQPLTIFSPKRIRWQIISFWYSPFHKTLPRSSLQMHWVSVRFYEMGDIWTIVKEKGNFL